MFSIILWIASGALAGLAASTLMKSRRSLISNILLGIAGSIIGGFLAGIFGIEASGIAAFAIAVGGACLLLYLSRWIRR